MIYQFGLCLCEFYIHQGFRLHRNFREFNSLTSQSVSIISAGSGVKACHSLTLAAKFPALNIFTLFSRETNKEGKSVLYVLTCNSVKMLLIAWCFWLPVDWTDIVCTFSCIGVCRPEAAVSLKKAFVDQIWLVPVEARNGALVDNIGNHLPYFLFYSMPVCGSVVFGIVCLIRPHSCSILLIECWTNDITSPFSHGWAKS